MENVHLNDIIVVIIFLGEVYMKLEDKKLKHNLIIATYTVVLAYILLNLSTVGGALTGVITVVKPFIIGIAIAFILNIPMRMYEGLLKKFMKPTKNVDFTKLIRPLSIVLTIVSVVGLIAAIIIFVVPQLISSGSTLVNNVPGYIDSLEHIIGGYTENTKVLESLYNEVISAGKEIVTFVGTLTTSLLSELLDITVGITSTIVNFVIAFIVSIYILLSKEKLILQIKKLLYAFIKEEKVKKIIILGRLVNDKFSKFISGQCIEACILGALCFVAMTIFSMPYALLISVLIAVTALIPVVGAFLGLIPATFIIFMVDPKTALCFIVMIIIIQQIEGNIIYPFVVGNSIGLSALWVLAAITIGGNLFGILGMLIGVPLFGVMYTIISYVVNKRIEGRKIE